MNKFDQEYRQMLVDFYVIEKKVFSKEESKEFKVLMKNKMPLPEDICYDQSTGLFFKIIHNEISDMKLNQLLMYKKLSYLRSIKNSMLFFVGITILSAIAWLIIIY